jgi:hypothetical protein
LSEFLFKTGTHLLASSDMMEKDKISLAWLRNAADERRDSATSRETQ